MHGNLGARSKAGPMGLAGRSRIGAPRVVVFVMLTSLLSFTKHKAVSQVSVDRRNREILGICEGAKGQRLGSRRLGEHVVDGDLDLDGGSRGRHVRLAGPVSGSLRNSGACGSGA
jgi:hypothetical protein